MPLKEDLQAILDQATPNDASGWDTLVGKISAALKSARMNTSLSKSQKTSLSNLKQYGINIDATNFKTTYEQPMSPDNYEAAFIACKVAIRDIFSVELGNQTPQAAANPAPAASKSNDKTPAKATPKAGGNTTQATPTSNGQKTQAAPESKSPALNPTVPPKPGGGSKPKKAPQPKAPAPASPSYSNINNLPQTAPQNIDDWNNILFGEEILKSIDKRKFAETIKQKWSEYVDITTTTRTETADNDDGEYLYQVINYTIQIKAGNWASMIAIKTTMGNAYTINQLVYDAFREYIHRR